MSAAVTLPAWAKINLALDILRKRDDGYHDLCMVMQSISLCDALTVEERGTGFSLQSDGFTVPAGKKSLEERACDAFFAALGRKAPALNVFLKKNVPAYAGLGGGSADVAALLRYLRRTFAPEMTDAKLSEIGLSIGSDVPFCLRGGTAQAEGRGEVLTDLTPLPDCHIILVKPDFDIPTPELFARVRVSDLRERPDISAMCRALSAGDLAGVCRAMRNVFEEVLPEEERRTVDALKARLVSRGALAAAMSGSGSTVFGIFNEIDTAVPALDALAHEGAKCFLAAPVSREQVQNS